MQDGYFKDLTKKDLNTVRWASLVALEDPLILKMGRDQIAKILEALVSQGLGPSTPCAIFENYPGTAAVSGTVGDISIKLKKTKLRTFYLELGESVAAGPLTGYTVLVTRAGKQAHDLSSLLQREGATVLEAPAIEIVLQQREIRVLERAVNEIADYSWLILTSVNTVSMLDEILRKKGATWKIFDRLRIACIGATTADRVRKLGGKVSLVPPRYQAESLAEEILKQEVRNAKILLPRAKGSREVLPKALADAGAVVHNVHLYRADTPGTTPSLLKKLLKEKQIDYVTFTSSSTVRNFVEMTGKWLSKIDPLRTRIACIGPVTETTLRQQGVNSAIVAKEFTMPGLVKAVVEDVTQRMKDERRADRSGHSL